MTRTRALVIVFFCYRLIINIQPASGLNFNRRTRSIVASKCLLTRSLPVIPSGVYYCVLLPGVNRLSVSASTIFRCRFGFGVEERGGLVIAN